MTSSWIYILIVGSNLTRNWDSLPNDVQITQKSEPVKPTNQKTSNNPPKKCSQDHPQIQTNVSTWICKFYKKFLLLFLRMLQKAKETGYININCVDPLGRSALLMAIDNENLEMVELLINHHVDTKDALLHAISEEFVEAVEVLLDHEDCSHRDGEPHVSKFL